MLLDFYNNPDGGKPIDKKLSLINEQTSPLHRIMWVYNINEPQKRAFENNICAFHVGDGYFLSVAHNLRLQAGYYRAIDNTLYRKEIFPLLDGSQSRLMDQHYLHDEYTDKRYLINTDPTNLNPIMHILKQKRFDTRWVTMADKGICTPHLIFQFRNNAFFNDPDMAQYFNANQVLFDNDARKYTFLTEVRLVKAFYGADIALYRIVNTPKEIIAKIPVADINFDLLDDTHDKLYCLQSSPSGPTGRLLNTAGIEGLLDHFGIFPDEVGGNYLFEGYRYLVKGYFRFGSSGAPYFCYNEERGRYEVNAIQSEASGIQLSIKNERDGNFQYVNAIASPLHIIKDELESYLQI